jgi:hypothetical protein
MTVTLGADLIPLLEKLTETLKREPLVRQQQAIELLMVCHALSLGDEVAARTVIHGMHKHALQMVTR